MDIEIIKEYSKKYKTHQVRLSMVFMILLIILGIIFIGVGIFLVIYDNDMWIITAIMILAGIFNIPLGIKFYYVSKHSILTLSDEEACKRYCKIYGIK